MKFYYVTNIFDLHTFENEMTVLLKFFEISTEIDFVSMYFLNEKKNYNLTFDDAFKTYCCALCLSKSKLHK